MVLVYHNVFGLFVRHQSWSVEGGAKVSKRPVHVPGDTVWIQCGEKVRHFPQYLQNRNKSVG